MKIIGNGLEVNFLTKKATVNSKEMTIEAFKNMCFQNNWEGTLHKVLSVERSLEAVLDKLFKEYGPK
jgi:hypothetical protein